MVMNICEETLLSNVGIKVKAVKAARGGGLKQVSGGSEMTTTI